MPLKTRIHEIARAGQSVWCDNLSRRLIESTDKSTPIASLRAMMEAGIVGVTSNPTIFMKAITGSDDYDTRIGRLIKKGCDVVGIYEGLVLEDIADAADLLRPVHSETNGLDGYVSLEVNPKLAYDTEGTIAEAKRLYAQLNRPNVLIKVPATSEGIPAVEALIAEGVSVNITLIFSLSAHERVMRAYLEGLKRRLSSGKDVRRVASVASFFVSRVDTLVDKQLREKGGAPAQALLGTAAVANAKLAYSRFREMFSAAGEFGALAQKGARVQRPLWASTSTKDPSFPDTKYVDTLIGRDTVNTMPPETILATLNHGQTASAIEKDVDEAKNALLALRDAGVDMDAVTTKLLSDGVASFAQSFEELMENLGRKQSRLCSVT